MKLLGRKVMLVTVLADGLFTDAKGNVDSFLFEGENVGDYIDSPKNDFYIVIMGWNIFEPGLKSGVIKPYTWLIQYL